MNDLKYKKSLTSIAQHQANRYQKNYRNILFNKAWAGTTNGQPLRLPFGRSEFDLIFFSDIHYSHLTW